MVKEKEFDLFLSYSHLDREFAKKIAKTLQKDHVRVWYDGWEMKPGDILRERISQGIELANYFLTIISDNSLDSSWVQYELNSAMIREIEQHHVRVIPAIIGNIDFKQLPLDLRMKYCLDFRTEGNLKQGINALVDLIQPEKRLHGELLTRLKNPTSTDISTIRELREHALRYGDQTIQIAAIRGLEKIGGTEAVLAITERMLDEWGVNGIKRAIKGLAKLASDGGLLALTATLPSDSRFYLEKIEAILSVVEKMPRPDLIELLTLVMSQINSHQTRTMQYMGDIYEILAMLEGAQNDDILNGAIIARIVRTIPSGPEEINQESLKLAVTYSEQRVPGLIRLLELNRNSI